MGTERYYWFEYSYTANNADGCGEGERRVEAETDKGAVRAAELFIQNFKRRLRTGNHFIDAELVENSGRRIKYWNTKTIAKL